MTLGYGLMIMLDETSSVYVFSNTLTFNVPLTLIILGLPRYAASSKSSTLSSEDWASVAYSSRRSSRSKRPCQGATWPPVPPRSDYYGCWARRLVCRSDRRSGHLCAVFASSVYPCTHPDVNHGYRSCAPASHTCTTRPQGSPLPSSLTREVYHRP